nr:sensor histidine kinase [Corynebacterium halotolerans]
MQASGLPGDAALRDGIHILTSVVLVAALVSSVRLPFNVAVTNLLLCSLFALLYFVGSANIGRWREPAQVAWVITLTAVWLVEMIVAPVGMYLLFTLFFLYLWVMDDLRGVLSVVFATAVAVIVQIPDGLTVGGVMGPAVSAIVTLAIHWAFRTLARISRDREQLIRQLMDTRTQLAETEHAAGVAAERQRLAHEIHDTLAQGLSSIQMLLHAAERDLQATGLSGEQLAGPLERITLARTVAADNLGEARAMIAALQPASLSQTSLAGALERMAANFGGTGGVDITVDVDGDGHQLPMQTEAALLRIAQGAVGNVVKHAGATRCRVTVTYEPDEVRLDVVDDGRGFDPADVAKRPIGLGHIGLDAMRRRAVELGGALEVESHPGSGTAVSASIPLTEPGDGETRIGRETPPSAAGSPDASEEGA